MGQTNWSGNFGDSDWGQNFNWDTFAVPGAGTNVTVPDVAPNLFPDLDTNTRTGNTNDLTIDLNASVDVGGQTLNVAGDLVVNGTLTINTGTLNVLGSISGSGSLTNASGAINVGGNIDFSALTFTAGTGTVTLNGGGAQSLDSGGNPMGNLTVFGAGTAVSLLNSSVLSTNLTIETGSSLSIGNLNLTVTGTLTTNGTGTVTANNGNIDVTGTVTNNGTIQTTGSGTQTYGNTVTSGGTITGGGLIDINADIDFSGGTLNEGAGGINVSGNFTGGAFADDAAGTLTFDSGAGGQSVSCASALGDVVVASGGTVQLAAGMTAGNLTISGGTLDQDTNNVTIDVNGNFLLGAGGTLLQNDDAMTLAGNWTNSGGTYTIAAGGEVDFDGGGGHLIDSDGVGTPFQRFILSNGTAQFINNNVRVNGVMQVQAGTSLNLNGFTLDANFTVDINGTLDASTAGSDITFGNDVDFGTGTFNPGTNTVTFDGTANPQNLTSATVSFNNLTVNKGAGSLVLLDGLDVNSALSLTAGTLNSNNQQINLAGNWDNTGGGTFTEANGTVVFDGGAVQTVSNAETFFNLTVSKTGGSLTFTGNLDVSNGMLVNAGAYDVALQGTTSTIAGATTFNNNGAGTVTFGDDAGDTVNFPAGVTATSPNQVNLAGILNTTGTLVRLDDVNLATGVTINSNGGLIDLDGGAVDGNQVLVLNAGAGNVNLGLTGDTIPLSSLDVNSTGTTSLGGNITTQGAGGVTLDGATDVNLTAGVTINTSTGGGLIDLTGGQVDGAQNLVLTSGAGNMNLGPMGQGVALASLDVNSSGTVNLSGNINAGVGGIDFSGSAAVELDASIALTSGGLIDLGSTNATTVTDSGAFGLTLNAVGALSTDDVTVDTITITGGTNLTLYGNLQATAGNINFSALADGDSIDLSTAAATITASGNVVTVGENINGGQALQIISGGTTVLQAVGNSTPVTSLDVNATGTLTLNGNITTGGAGGVALDGSADVDLGAGVTINTSTGGGLIDLTGGQVDGAQNLVLTSGAGNMNLGPLGQNIALASLDVNSSGTVNLSGNIDTDGGNMDFSGSAAVDLDASVTLTTSTAGDIDLGSTNATTVTDSGAFGLTLNAVGALSTDDVTVDTITITGGTNLTLYGNLQATAGNINFSALADGDSIDLSTAAATITASGNVVTVGENINGAQTLQILSGGTTVLQAVGNSTPVTSLDVNATGTLTLNGNITTNGLAGVALDGSADVNLTAGVTIDTSAGNGLIDLTGGAVDGNQALVLNAGGGNVDLGPLGQVAALSSLDVNATGTTTLGGSITTQTAAGVALDGATDVDLGAGITIDTTTGNGLIDLTGGTVDGNQALVLNAGGGNVNLGLTGDTTPLSSLDVNSTGTTSLGGNITTQTVAGVTLDGATDVNLTAGVTIDTSAGGGLIDLTGGQVDGAQNLVLTSGAGNMNLGPLGQNIALASLDVNSSGTVNLSGDIDTDGGNIDFSGSAAVNLDASVTLTTSIAGGHRPGEYERDDGNRQRRLWTDPERGWSDHHRRSDGGYDNNHRRDEPDLVWKPAGNCWRYRLLRPYRWRQHRPLYGGDDDYRQRKRGDRRGTNQRRPYAADNLRRDDGAAGGGELDACNLPGCERHRNADLEREHQYRRSGRGGP